MSKLLSASFSKNVPEEYGAALARLDDIVLESIIISIIEALPEEKIPEFEAALSLSDPRVLEAFLAHEVPNLHAIIAETLTEVQDDATEVISLLES